MGDGTLGNLIEKSEATVSEFLSPFLVQGTRGKGIRMDVGI
jgi:hypothetical protein